MLSIKRSRTFRPEAEDLKISKRLRESVYIGPTSWAGNLRPAGQIRQNHSTETALLKLHSDILSAVDNGCVVVLVLLDLTAAFDTIDHGILLSRLRHRFGVTGAALDWLRSYLADRKQLVRIESVNL